MTTKKFNNADSLVEYCIENNILVGQVFVDHPVEKGNRTLLAFWIKASSVLSTHIYGQHDIDGIDYAWDNCWQNYTGSFELVLPFDQFTKPKIYAVGDTVEILENAKECESYVDWTIRQKQMVGETYEILRVNDDNIGLSYTIRCYRFPSYCVKKVENRPKEMTQAQIEQELGYKINII